MAAWLSGKNDENIKNMFSYLEDERKKLWAKIIALEEEFSKKTPEFIAEARQASKKSSEFRNRCEEAKNDSYRHLEEIENKLQNIQELFKQSEELYNEIKVAGSNCNETENKSQLIYDEITTRKNDIENKIIELESIFTNHQSFVDKVTKLENTFVKGDDFSTKIESVYKSIVTRKKEIDELYYEIIGYSEKDEETGEDTNVNGLKDDLENAYNELKANFTNAEKELTSLKINTDLNYKTFQENITVEFETYLKNCDKKFTAISEKIESLLPNALTAGLSHAYSKKKTDEVLECEKNKKAFNYAISGMIIVSLIPFIISVIFLMNGQQLDDAILKMPRLVISILPLYLPVLWVAYSSNKNLKLSKRLIEEYTHKEVLSKTFEGLSRQIETIDDKNISTDLRNKLMFNILEVSSENPGKLISDYNKSDHPLMDALDKSIQLTNAVDKLSRIPGFSNLANKLDKKSKDMLAEEENKANKGLDHVV